MSFLNSDSNQFLRDLLTAIGVIAATLALTGAVRKGIRAAGKHKNWAFLAEMAPALSNVIYIMGLKLLADLAPLLPTTRQWIDSAIYVIVVVILLGIVRRGAMIGVEWSARRSAPSKTLQQGFLPLMRNVVTLFVFLTGGIMILKHFNYDVLSLVTALGVGSLAVGLAAKDTLSNMISGFTLIIDRNLTPGDVINLAGTVGEVDEIGLRSTRIRTCDGNMLIVPNAELVNTRILNLSTPTPEVTCSAQFRIPHAAPFEKVKAVCLAAVHEVSCVRRERNAWVNLTGVADGQQAITVGFWISSHAEQGSAQSELYQKLLAKLRSENIPLVAPPPAP